MKTAPAQKGKETPAPSVEEKPKKPPEKTRHRTATAEVAGDPAVRAAYLGAPVDEVMA